MNTAVWRRSEGLGARTKGQTGGLLGDCAWTGLREGVISSCFQKSADPSQSGIPAGLQTRHSRNFAGE
jgi:hypothetical protein